MYSQILKVFLISVLFLPMIPIGIPITIFGLVIYYWLMKYKLLRITKKPRYTSEQLGLTMSYIAQFGIVFYGVGVSFLYEKGEFKSINTKIIGVISLFLVLFLFISPFVSRYTSVNLKNLINLYRNEVSSYTEFSK